MKKYCGDSPFSLEPGEYIKIEITDNGKTTDPREMERFFEPFYTTKKISSGENHTAGLGLTRSFFRVVEMGGEIDLVPAPGQGITALIFLPSKSGHD